MASSLRAAGRQSTFLSVKCLGMLLTHCSRAVHPVWWQVLSDWRAVVLGMLGAAGRALSFRYCSILSCLSALQMCILDGNAYDAKCLEAGQERDEDLEACSLLINNKQQALLVPSAIASHSPTAKVIVQLTVCCASSAVPHPWSADRSMHAVLDAGSTCRCSRGLGCCQLDWGRAGPSSTTVSSKSRPIWLSVM